MTVLHRGISLFFQFARLQFGDQLLCLSSLIFHRFVSFIVSFFRNALQCVCVCVSACVCVCFQLLIWCLSAFCILLMLPRQQGKAPLHFCNFQLPSDPHSPCPNHPTSFPTRFRYVFVLDVKMLSPVFPLDQSEHGPRIEPRILHCGKRYQLMGFRKLTIFRPMLFRKLSLIHI